MRGFDDEQGLENDRSFPLMQHRCDTTAVRQPFSVRPPSIGHHHSITAILTALLLEPTKFLVYCLTQLL